jgi:hypothetical protein
MTFATYRQCNDLIRVLVLSRIEGPHTYKGLLENLVDLLEAWVTEAMLSSDRPTDDEVIEVEHLVRLAAEHGIGEG